MRRGTPSTAVRLAAALLASTTLLSACATSESAPIDALSMPGIGAPASPIASSDDASPQPIANAQSNAQASAQSNAPDAALSNDTLTVAATTPGVDRSSAGTPDAAEIDYARATATGIFRRRTSQRAAAFIPVEGPGYGLCLRAPAKSGKGHDHALIVFSRRLNGAPISQVDDDTIVYRRAADAAPCRAGGIDWVRLVG